MPINVSECLGYWNLKDIRQYLGCGVNKASYIRHIAINKFNGKCGWNKHKVKKESVLQAIEYLDNEA